MKVTEIASGIARNGRINSELYEWDPLSKSSKPMRIPIDKLHIDEYQRGEATRASTIRKARHFNHAAAGSVIVGRRANGEFYVVDGLQRTLAEALRGDIKYVDCMVFESEGKEHESHVFDLCNTGRTPVSAIHKFRVRVTSGRPLECTINSWLLENGLRISSDKGKNDVGFPSYIIQFWDSNPIATQRALLFTKRIGEGEMCSDIFKGAYILISRGIDIEDYEYAISKRGGHHRLLRDINTVAIETGLSKNFNICARGILNSINYRRKNRIELPLS
jgi:hypothetical protein